VLVTKILESIAMELHRAGYIAGNGLNHWWRELHARYDGKLNLPIFRALKLIQYAIVAWMGYNVVIYAKTVNTEGFKVLLSLRGIIVTVIVLAAFYVETSLEIATDYFKKKILESA
jgi:hypothetical protein